MMMEWVLRKMTYHGEQSKVPHVEMGFSRQAPCKEENDGVWCFLVQSLQALEYKLVMLANYPDLSLVED